MESEQQLPAKDREFTAMDERPLAQRLIEGWMAGQSERYGARDGEPVFKAVVRGFWERHFGEK